MPDDLRSLFVEGMSRAATFVAVATTDGPAGRYGVTVSSMTSVSADGEMPSLLLCINSASATATAVLHNRSFCANLLDERQQALSDLFAGRGGADQAARFAAVGWRPGPDGQPNLDGATAAFECRLATAMLWETHYIIVGRVTAVALSDSRNALLYGQRSYRRAVDLTPE